jgi:hypothetical protein
MPTNIKSRIPPKIPHIEKANGIDRTPDPILPLSILNRVDLNEEFPPFIAIYVYGSIIWILYISLFLINY